MARASAGRARGVDADTRESSTLPAHGSGRPLADRLFGWGRRSDKETPESGESGSATAERTVPTKAFAKIARDLTARYAN